MRLAKHLAHAGVASRRAAEELIHAGRVQVEDQVVTDPAHDVGAHSRIRVDGRPLVGPEPRVVHALHKPPGVLSTARDPHGRPTVLDLLPPGPTPSLRLYPVGRLDKDTSGLILLTNDGPLANRLTHPRHEVPKTYRARVARGPVGESALQALRQGVLLDDGPTAPARVRQPRPGTLELTIHEGRNRQVRRMCQAVGHPVLALQRVAFGPLRLGDLAPGDHRRLSEAEIARLRAAAKVRDGQGDHAGNHRPP
jgi:23S rRNA pseudouridine2605 synthase